MSTPAMFAILSQENRTAHGLRPASGSFQLWREKKAPRQDFGAVG
jgi:hypothetical protein